MLKVALWFRRPDLGVDFYQDSKDRTENYELCKRTFWEWAGKCDLFKSENLYVFESDGGLVRNVVHYFEDEEEYISFKREHDKLIQGGPFNGVTPQTHPDLLKYNEENGITTNVNDEDFGVIEI